MSIKIPNPERSLTQDPPVSFHFLVVFFIAGVTPNPLDIRFQKVSGLTATIETEELREGGENLLVHRLPKQVTYDNLSLERGMVIDSPLNMEFDETMSTMQFAPSNILVMLLNDSITPLAGWSLQNAYPVKWSISDLDANHNGVVIDTMELAYSRFQRVRI